MRTLTLATTYDPRRHDCAGWLCSEKLDGVRACLDADGQMWTRNGKPILPPADWAAGLPRGVELDGELWGGRGTLERTAGAVRAGPRGDWSGIRFAVFDAPGAAGGFSERLAEAGRIASAAPVCAAVEHWPVDGADDVDAALDRVRAAGGEGVVLRDPSAPYVPGRSASTLKHKPIETDEATVTGREVGTGRNAGAVSVLVCTWRGRSLRLSAGLTDALRAAPPAIGAAVTFAFSGISAAGEPRCVRLVEVRNYE